MMLPVLKSNEIVQQLQTLQLDYTYDGVVNEFLHRKLLRECEALCNLDGAYAADGYRLKAALYALAGKQKETIDAYQEAEFRAYFSATHLLDKANNLQRAGLHSLAREALYQAYSIHNHDPEILQRSLKVSYALGQYTLGLEAINLLDHLNRSDLINEYRESINNSVKLSEKAKVTDNEIFDRIAFVHKVLFDHTKKSFSGFRQHATENGIAYCIPMHSSISVLIEYDWLIADSIVNYFDDPLDHLITFSTILPHARH
ncbi:hypothetical protein VI06_16205 [Aquitalea magnusonii]|nr:hypothetical protein VI06_16205 [Aquitalea magnusonii]